MQLQAAGFLSLWPVGTTCCCDKDPADSTQRQRTPAEQPQYVGTLSAQFDLQALHRIAFGGVGVVHLEVVAGHVNTDDAGGAAHTGQVVGQHIRAHLEVVHHHGRQRGRGRKAGADHDQNVHLQCGITSASGVT